MKPVIEVKNLSRYFYNKKQQVTAVENLNFEILPGTIFGLLGPNGAGKSTTIKMLTTILSPDKGQVKILGWDLFKDEKKIRPKISLLYGGEHGLYTHLDARDNLRFFGSLYKINKKTLESRIDYWLSRVGLLDNQYKLVGGYSKGMKQRLHIARAMLHNPEVIFLDEPTLGLDPKGTIELRNIIKEEKSKGKTIILTTHDMEEAQELCDHFAFIMDGKLIKKGTLTELQDLLQQHHQYEIETSLDPSNYLKFYINDFIDGYDVTQIGKENYLSNFHLPKSEKGDLILNEIIKKLSSCRIKQVISKKIDLRSMYLQLLEDHNAS